MKPERHWSAKRWIQVITLLILTLPSIGFAQYCPNCPTCPQGGVCLQQPITTDVVFDPLTTADQDDIDITTLPQEFGEMGSKDRFDRVIEATCRITVGNTCGSGTVVGRDSLGNALVLTNAHVAGTRRGRIVKVQRWNADGSSEVGNGAIITAGYGRGLSIDFALLKCNAGFAKDITPIPIADRYPDTSSGVTTYGCPRCEWPSLQVLKMVDYQKQVLRWQPQAIGGRSGSSLVDYTADGPRVVGLLTWGGNGYGLGQSMPFVLDAMRGRLPKNFEPLPAWAREVTGDLPDGISMMPASIDGTHLAFQLSEADETDGTADADLIDQITEDGPDKDDSGLFRSRPDNDTSKRPFFSGISDLLNAIRDWIWTALLLLAAAVGGFLVGRFWR